MRIPKTCERCDLGITCRNSCVWGTGNPDADLFLIGEAPGFVEDLNHKPFIGPAGQLLDHILNKLGIDRSSIWITNVIKCRPPKNELPKGDDLAKISTACFRHLRYELQQVDPKVVVLLGGTPLSLLTGERFITRVEGMELDTIYEGAKTYACYHPAYVLRSPSKESNVARVLYKAAKKAGVKVRTKGWEAGVYDYELRA